MFTLIEVSKSVLNFGFYFPLLQRLFLVMTQKGEQFYMLDYSRNRKSNSTCYMKSFIYIYIYANVLTEGGVGKIKKKKKKERFK